MDCKVLAIDFLRNAYPEVDVRLIKATILEHGDDIKSSIRFLESVVNELKDASSVEHTKDSFFHQSSTTTDSKGIPDTVLCDDNVATELSNSTASSISQDILAGIVEEAKSDKELVMNLVKEVSNLRDKADQENIAALRAKSDAATRGEGLLKKVDEMRKQTSQKKQDNLLRMGEIYGERAVLVTEARELKLRLEQLKVQREGTITTLHEIQVRLQYCYDTAAEDRKIAEEEGIVKAEKAQKLLAEEEALLAIVEEESQNLEMEAEACTQFKEFLAHHGSIVDSLQGEMSVLREDVELFKRQVEEGMWSSVSTASLQSNVNPEGPYTFRRCKMPSTTSSQDLGQSLDGSKHSYSRISASTNEDVPYLSEQSNVSSLSSQELDKRMNCSSSADEGSECNRQFVKNGSLPCGGEEDVTSNIVGTPSGDIGGIGSSFSSVEMPTNGFSLHEGNCALRSGASMNAIKESVHDRFANLLNNTCLPAERLDSLRNTDGTIESTDLDITERLDSECAGADWVLTTKKLEDSRSSTSSMVKVGAEDYGSE